MDRNLADLNRSALLQPVWADALAQVARTAVDAGLCHYAGVVEMADDGRVCTTTATDAVVEGLTELQCVSGHGPAIDAILHAGVLHSGDAATDDRWPVWGVEAGRRGIGGVVGVHLSGVNKVHGALVLYHRGSRTYTAEDLTAAELIGAHASIALAHLHDTEHLWRAIDARHRIGQAQGILMERFNISAEAAFSLLRRLSQDGHVKLHLVADQVVRTRTLPTASDFRSRDRPVVVTPGRSPAAVLPRVN